MHLCRRYRFFYPEDTSENSTAASDEENGFANRSLSRFATSPHATPSHEATPAPAAAEPAAAKPTAEARPGPKPSAQNQPLAEVNKGGINENK